MANFSTVPIVDVNKDNFQSVWPSLLLAVRTSTFVALDLELSGLGNRRKLNARSIDDRYAAISEVAKTRSVLSVGLSCFKLQATQKTFPKDETKSEETAHAAETSVSNGGHASEQEKTVSHSWQFLVQSFNITLLCANEFVVEPVSLKFLVDHGFDFNRQFSSGVSYYPGSDKEDYKEEVSIRYLFSELALTKKPIVLHNALIDLVFMYQSFHTNLPSTMNTFVADMSELFAGGIYDTKYISEFSLRLSASYLEYVFRKSQRENAVNEKKGCPHVALAYLQYDSFNNHVNYLPCGLQMAPPAKKTDNLQGEQESDLSGVCEVFAAHGWCVMGKSCPNSHDIDCILDSEDAVAEKKKKRRNRKRHRNENNSDSQKQQTDLDGSTCEDSEQNTQQQLSAMETESPKIDSEPESRSVQGINIENTAPKPPNICIKGGHRAGFDSFMTGFAFACMISKYADEAKVSCGVSLHDMGMSDFVNKICLTGKDIPLQVVKSNFAKTSKDHREKMSAMLGNK